MTPSEIIKLLPPAKLKKPDIYSAHDVGWNEYRDMVIAILEGLKDDGFA